MKLDSQAKGIDPRWGQAHKHTFRGERNFSGGTMEIALRTQLDRLSRPHKLKICSSSIPVHCSMVRLLCSSSSPIFIVPLDILACVGKSSVTQV
jgi:hypothetical protein